MKIWKIAMQFWYSHLRYFLFHFRRWPQRSQPCNDTPPQPARHRCHFIDSAECGSMLSTAYLTLHTFFDIFILSLTHDYSLKLSWIIHDEIGSIVQSDRVNGWLFFKFRSCFEKILNRYISLIITQSWEYRSILFSLCLPFRYSNIYLKFTTYIFTIDF